MSLRVVVREIVFVRSLGNIFMRTLVSSDVMHVFKDTVSSFTKRIVSMEVIAYFETNLQYYPKNSFMILELYLNLQSKLLTIPIAAYFSLIVLVSYLKIV